MKEKKKLKKKHYNPPRCGLFKSLAGHSEDYTKEICKEISS